jgi:hypothetical protein
MLELWLELLLPSPFWSPLFYCSSSASKYSIHNAMATKSRIKKCLFVFCRKHRPSYETIALTPRKYWSGSGSGTGWLGDPETNIPALLFPKHVLGLHATDDHAFHRDFEIVHSVSHRMRNLPASLNNGSAASAYPDILNGGCRGKHLSRRTARFPQSFFNTV